MIHPSADVQSLHIGEGTRIWQFCVVLPGAKIGKNCNICSHCFIENEVAIGDNVTIKNGVYLYDGVTLEDNVFVGPGAVFCNDRRPVSRNPKFKPEHIIVKEGAVIGAHVTIAPGIVIGRNAFVHAGQLVKTDVADNAIVR